MDEVATIEQPRERLLDLVGRILAFELAEEVAETAAAFADCGSERAIEFAMKKEFAIFRIEAHRIGRQQIDAEVW